MKKKETISTMIIFSLITIVIFSFSFNVEKVEKDILIPGMLWIMIIFSSLLCLGPSFKKEQNNNTFAGLLMAPIDRSAIYYGKVLANMFFITLVEIISIPLFFFLFNFSMNGNILLFTVSILLGTFGFIAIGTFLSALTAHARFSELLLPVTLFPISIPILIGSIKLTGILITGNESDFSPWIQLLVVVNVVFLLVPLLIFEYILEA